MHLDHEAAFAFAVTYCRGTAVGTVDCCMYIRAEYTDV